MVPNFSLIFYFSVNQRQKVVQAQKYNRFVLKTNIPSNIYMTVAKLFDFFGLLVSYCRGTNTAGVHIDS